MKILSTVFLLFGMTYAQDCELGWVKRPNSSFCYLFDQNAATYSSALDGCSFLGGMLTNIADQEEQDFISALIKLQTNNVWIGLIDNLGKGIWKWDNYFNFFMCMNFTFWDSGEPSYDNGYYECVVINTTNNFRWENKRCDSKFPFVCKKPLVGTFIAGPMNKTCSNTCNSKYPATCLLAFYENSKCTFVVQVFNNTSNNVNTSYAFCDTEETTTVTATITTTNTPLVATTPAATTTNAPLNATTPISATTNALLTTTTPTTKTTPRKSTRPPRRHQNKKQDRDCEENSRFRFSHRKTSVSRFGDKGRK